MSAGDYELSLKIQALIRGLDEVLEEQYGHRVGFVLLLAPFDQEVTHVQYAANCRREYGVEIIRKLFERWQLELPDVPFHEKQ